MPARNRPVTLRQHFELTLTHQFASFDQGRAWKDIKWGIPPQILVGLPLVRWWGLGRASDILYVIIIQLTVLIADVTWRFGKSVWIVCRKEQFRNDSITTLFAVLYICGFAGMARYVQYSNSPHLSAKINGPVLAAHIRELPDPTGAIWFTRIDMQNKGIPSITRNWKVVVKFISGDEATGYPATKTQILTDRYGQEHGFLLGNSIYWKTAHVQITRSGSQDWFAVFLLPYIRQELLMEPSTIFTVVYEDERGNKYSLEYKVPAEGNYGGPRRPS